MNWMKTLNLQVKLALPIVPMLSDYFLTTSSTSMTEEERANVAGMRASWKALAQVNQWCFSPNNNSLQPLLMKRFVYSPRTLKPSGTPLCSSLTRPQKPCSLTSLQPLSSPQSLTCSSQVPLSPRKAPHFHDFVLNPQKLNALWVNCEEQARWLTSVVCQVTVNHYMPTSVSTYLFDLFSWMFKEINFSCTGIGHGHFFDASLECHQRFHEHFKLAIDKYLLE